MNPSRKLKVYQKIRRREFDSIIIPEIRLEGIWLHQLGFEVGKEVRVEQRRNKLVITLVSEG